MPNAESDARFDALSTENAALRRRVRDAEDRSQRLGAELAKANRWASNLAHKLGASGVSGVESALDVLLRERTSR